MLFNILICCLIFNIINCLPCGNGGDDCTVDIVFVMDSSGSVDSTEWGESVDFVNGVIDGLGSPSNVGIVEFDTNVEIIYSICEDQSDCDHIQNTLSAYPYDGGGTNIEIGVQAGIDQLNVGCGDDEHEKVLILITDGFSNAGGNPCDLDFTGITNYIVKVDAATANSVIDCLVNDPDNDIFEVESFGDISELTDQLRDSICHENCPLNVEFCNRSPNPCGCNEVSNCPVCNEPSGCAQCVNGYFKLTDDSQCENCQDVFGYGCLFCQDYNGCGQCRDGYYRYKLPDCPDYREDVYGCKRKGIGGNLPCFEDVIIAIDESGSLSDTEFALSKMFSINLINMINDGQTEIGVIGFGSSTKLVYPLSEGDPSEAVSAVSFMQQVLTSSTRYIAAIEAAVDMFNGQGNNGRPNVLVIVSDGVPTDNPCATTDSTDLLESADVTTIIVGIGPDFDEASSDITCLTSGDKIFSEPEFTSSALNAILLDVAFEVCDYVCPNGGTTSEPDLNPFTGCPLPCDLNNPNNPCQCDELCFCDICHSPEGCDQCFDGYFKKNYNYPCIKCDESIFGDGCMFCQDFHGCGQCRPGYNRVYDFTCGLYKCV